MMFFDGADCYDYHCDDFDYFEELIAIATSYDDDDYRDNEDDTENDLCYSTNFASQNDNCTIREQRYLLIKIWNWHSFRELKYMKIWTWNWSIYPK